MTDAPKLPPFPEKPVQCGDYSKYRDGLYLIHEDGVDEALITYYRDLAAAWEAVARHAVNDLQVITEWSGNPDNSTLAEQYALDCLKTIGPLPPKEG